VEQGHRYVHPKLAPRQWVWRSAALLPLALSEVLYRRTLDWEERQRKLSESQNPVRLLMPASSGQVDRWLAGHLDDELLTRWISRLSLFDWRFASHAVRSLAPQSNQSTAASGALCLFGLFQPLFDLRPVVWLSDTARSLLPPESDARKPAAARTLAGFLRIRDVAAAVRFAGSRYAMGGNCLIRSSAPWEVGDTERLTASLLFPVCDRERSALVERWLRPSKNDGE
jgi:CRISPR-associated protein Csx17